MIKYRLLTVKIASIFVGCMFSAFVYSQEITPLSFEEQQFIKEHPVIKSHIKNSPPYHFWEDSPKGIAVDILDIITDKYGFKIEYVYGNTLAQSIDAIANKSGIKQSES